MKTHLKVEQKHTDNDTMMKKIRGGVGSIRGPKMRMEEAPHREKESERGDNDLRSTLQK